jgi:chitinase
MDAAGAKDGKQYYVTVATSARQSDIVNVEYSNFSQYLDWINLMTYDFHVVGLYYHGSNYNAGLYSNPKDPSPEPSKSKDNVDGAVQSLINFGVPKEKIMVGIGSYGRGWAGVTTPPFSDYSGAPYGTSGPGFFNFYDLQENYVNKNGFKRHWDKHAQVPWLYNKESHIWITYDDEKSYKLKAEYVVDNSLGGMFIW